MEIIENSEDCCKDKGVMHLYLLKTTSPIHESIDAILTDTFGMSTVQVTEIKKFVDIIGACLIYTGMFEDTITRAQLLANLGIAHKVTDKSIIT